MASSLKNSVDGVDDEIPEHLICPICFELPQKEVYQCRDGHVLCKDCYFQLSECPQCRDVLDKVKPIRNRHFEGLLDELHVDCPFKSNGCSRKVLRTAVEEHRIGCHFDVTKFGKLVILCKLIGYANCDFKVNRGNGKEAVKHFQSAHQFNLTKSAEFFLELDSFQVESLSSKDNQFWTPVIIETLKGFILIAGIVSTQECLTFAAIYFKNGEDDPPPIQFEFKSPIDEEKLEMKLSFTQKCTPVCKLSTSQPWDQFHKLPFKFLSENFTKNGVMEIKCTAGHVKNEAIAETAVEMERISCTKNNAACVASTTSTVVPQTPNFWNRNNLSYSSKSFLIEQETECKFKRDKVMTFLQNLFESETPEGVVTPKDLEILKTGSIFFVAKYGSLEAMEYLLRTKPNLNLLNEEGNSALHCCMLDVNLNTGLEKAKLLILSGADPKILNNYRSNLLHYAAWKSNEQAVEYFLRRGWFEVNEGNLHGNTPLHLAMKNENEEVVMKIAHLLSKNGGDLYVKTNAGETPLDLAAKRHLHPALFAGFQGVTWIYNKVSDLLSDK